MCGDSGLSSGQDALSASLVESKGMQSSISIWHQLGCKSCQRDGKVDIRPHSGLHSGFSVMVYSLRSLAYQGSEHVECVKYRVNMTFYCTWGSLSFSVCL